MKNDNLRLDHFQSTLLWDLLNSISHKYSSFDMEVLNSMLSIVMMSIFLWMNDVVLLRLDCITKSNSAALEKR